MTTVGEGEPRFGQVGSLLGSPRFVGALTTAIVGVAILSFDLRQLMGWAGIVGMLGLLVLLSAGSLYFLRAAIEWRGLLPISLLGFVGWASVSFVWSQYHWASFEGILYFASYTFLGIYVALVRDTIQVVRIFGDVLRVVLLGSLVLEVLAGILLDTRIELLGIQGNIAFLGPIQGLMGTRNQLGLVALIAVITFGVEFRTRSVSRTKGVLSILLAIAAGGLARSPVIAAVLVVVCLAAGALYGLRRVRAERRTLWQLVLLALVVAAGFAAWVLRVPIISAFSANADLSYRVQTWQKVWDLIAVHPLEGWGWIGLWHLEIQPFHIFEAANVRMPPSALNGYLDVWFQLGLVGVFLFLALILLTFARSWLLAGRQRSFVYAWPALVLVALLTTSLAESSMLVEYGWMVFVVCCVKAARELSWRRAFMRADLSDPGLPSAGSEHRPHPR